MADDFEKAFALRDNPFGPILPLGLNNFALQDSLEIKPLLINSEPKLEKLFSLDAGPFGTYLEKFQKRARLMGFKDAPPTAGYKSNLFSIWGYQGTGKSTFAQAVITWLEKCKPVTGNWHVHHEWSYTKEKDTEKQKQRIEGEQGAIVKVAGKNSYCCIVIDNLVAGAMDRALQMYDELTLNRVVFMFLISSDPELYPRLSGDGKRPITPYRMSALSANEAVAFVRDRIAAFRVEQAKQPSWLAAHSLYPFDEDDIRSAFAGGILLKNIDTVALRDFSVMVNRMLMNKLDALDDAFDITAKTAAEIKPHIISLSAEYNELMAA